MTNKEKSDIARKLRVLNHVLESGNVSKTCRYFGVSKETYYRWKRDYEKHGEQGRWACEGEGEGEGLNYYYSCLYT